ncbi:MAG: hypothetical protein RL398_2366, partial [Planctomycetota bacterium]
MVPTSLFVAPLRALLLLAVACLAAIAPAQDDAAKLDAVKEFRNYFKKFKEESQQIEAVMTLKGQECVPAAEELLKLLKHPSATVQQAAFDVLATYGAQSTWQAWIDAMPKEKDQAQLALMTKVLGRAKIEAAVPNIEAAAAAAKAAATLKFEAARALQ